MRDGIDWREVGSGGRFEQIVSVLLSTLHPESRRIDGAGGDGGRDHEMYVDNKLILWQCKYFMGRIADGGRKKQIINSLVTAAGRQPDEWELVTPIVPTPEELRWLQTEASKYPFSVTWRGGDWLEQRLAEHPSIVRHFMGPNDAYVSLIRELNEERDAAVDGVEAAVPRLEALIARANESNPFYKFALAFDGDGHLLSCQAQPKYVGAEEDSPITVKFSVRDAQGRLNQVAADSLRAAIDWGDQVETEVYDLVIDGPPGLGTRAGRARIVLSTQSRSVKIPIQLVVWSVDGRKVAALPARMVDAVRGERGITVTGQDHTGIISAKLRFDEIHETVSLTLHFNEWPASLPGQLLPALRFMRHLRGTNLLSFDLDADSVSRGVPIPQELWADNVEGYVQFVENLEHIQSSVSNYFEVPQQWTGLDALEARRASRLLRGERVQVGKGPVTFSMDGDAAAGLIEAATGGGPAAVALDAADNYVAHICGHDIDLGPSTYYLQNAQVEATRSGSAEVTKVTATPNGQHGLEVGLGRMQHSPGDPAD